MGDAGASLVVTAAPEPSSIALLAAGAASLCFAVRRRSQIK
jgi:hypothetical protein